MNILNLHETVDVAGGAEVYIAQLQENLAEAGHRSFWLGVTENDKGFTLSISNTSGRRRETLIGIINVLKSFIEENAIDIINIHSLFQIKIVNYCLLERPVFKFSHSPVMVCPGRDKFWRHSERICDIKYGLHCFMHAYTEGCANRHPKRIISAWKYVRYETRYASKRYAKIIVMSDFIKNGLQECGVSGDSICVNPYFTPVRSKPVSFSNQSYQKRILFAGRLASSKGIHLLIEAVIGILRADSNVFLDIVGDGAMKDQLVKKVFDAGLQDQIIFHGWQRRDRIDGFLSECYMVAFPSIYPEAFGIVGIEAMMHAKPVVAFDVGGVSTWLVDGETGFLVERANVPEMAKRIRHLLSDAVAYERMASNAYSMAIAKFSPHVHIHRLLELYNKSLLKS